MTMQELVFEIGCENIPARFVDHALKDLKARLQAALDAARIDHTVRAIGTPRRLTLIAEVAERQKDLEEVRTGPPIAAAWRDGQPTKAATGFAQGQGVQVEDLFTVETPKGSYIAARVFDAGKPAAEVLPQILHDLIAQTSFPKSMRWADLKVSFARPVRWIVAVLDGNVLDLEWAGVKSSNITFGHRFAAPGPITVTNPAGYLKALAKAHVVIDPAERRARIAQGLYFAADKSGGQLLDDPELLDEVLYLVEDPHVLVVHYDPEYLKLPPEVLISSMRSHQRYFAIQNFEGRLLPACAVVYNTPVKDPAVVAAGNLRVLKARLDDARFFWDQDLKHSLDDHARRLENVVWLKQLGSVAERVRRITHTTRAIATELGLTEVELAHATRAAELAKADLACAMVSEFPDLQGVMGRAYAQRAGEPDEVAQAIYEQYLPKGPQTQLSAIGSALALAEKLDSLAGCFGIGLIPTASADPYALRRAALGIVRILQQTRSVSLPRLVQLAVQAYPADLLKSTPDEVTTQILDFIGTRLRHSLAQTFPTDIVEAVIVGGLEDVLSISDRVEALAAIRPEPDFEPLAQGFKRVVNILKKQGAVEQAPNKTSLQDPAELALFDAVTDAETRIQQAISQRQWRQSCQTLITLKAPIDLFFDQVMVMAEDPELRLNRLALLSRIQRLFLSVADLSVIS